MNKLSLSFTSQEVKILNTVLGYVLTSMDVKDLRQNTELYLMLSALYEFYNKVKLKSDDIISFGCPPGKEVKLIMSRTQALAFYLVVCGSGQEADSLLPAVPDSTQAFIRKVVSEIHKQFLV